MLGYAAYPTYQVFLALFVSSLITFAAMPFYIKLMRYKQIGQQIRAVGPQDHLVKQGTPTMGGVVILLATFITTFLFARITPELLLAVGATVVTGLLGFIDDMSKVVNERSLGLTPSAKLINQALIAIVFGLLIVNVIGIHPVVRIPGIPYNFDLSFLSTTFTVAGVEIVVPWLYLLCVFLLMAGFSNAVNLTDGLDGLAGGAVFITMGVMAMICFKTDHLPLAVFAAATGGACVGFLWFNSHPADIFMGDTSSLALGAALSALAMLTQTELVSLVIGGLFIIEALSVAIQVVAFHALGKRVFLMAPLHHHFEKRGWGEQKVVIRFWIITAAFAALGFALFFQLS